MFLELNSSLEVVREMVGKRSGKWSGNGGEMVGKWSIWGEMKMWLELRAPLEFGAHLWPGSRYHGYFKT